MVDAGAPPGEPFSEKARADLAAGLFIFTLLTILDRNLPPRPRYCINPPEAPEKHMSESDPKDPPQSQADYSDAILRTTRQPFLTLDGSLRVRRANPAFCELFKVSPEETEDTLIYDLGNGQWDIAKLRRLLEEVLTENGEITDYRIEHKFEQIGERVMLLNATRMKREGRSDHILLAISDITERERLQEELEGRSELTQKLVDAVREGLLVLDNNLCVQEANESFYETFKVSPRETKGKRVYDLGNGQWNIPGLRTALEEILPHEKTLDDYTVDHEFENLGRRVMLLNARRVDHLELILLAIRDVTEEEKSETQREVLMGELQHRVKNILTNVRALSMQTRRNSRNLEDFTKAFDGRLEALARTQSLLVRDAEGKAELKAIVIRELEAHGVEPNGRFAISGDDASFDARTAQAVQMAIHELATNAVKYGALQAQGGFIDVQSRIDCREDCRWLRIRWRETGVEIEDRSPEKSFGASVIEQSLPYMLDGRSELTFHADGVECNIEFPLSETSERPAST